MKRKNTTSVQSTSNAAIVKNGKIYGVFYSYTDYVINGLNNSKSNYTKKQNQIDKFAKVGRATNEDISSYYNSRIATGSLTGNKDWIIWTDIFTEIIKDKSLTLDEANQIMLITDKILKRELINESLRAKDKYPSRGFKNEIYVYQNRAEFKQELEDILFKCVRAAYTYVTHKTLKGWKPLDTHSWRPNQEEKMYQPCYDALIDNDVITAAIHQGSGKTPLSLKLSEDVCKNILKSEWKVLGFANTQSNVIQQAYAFTQFVEKQTGKKHFKTYIIGAFKEDQFPIIDGCMEIVSKSDTSKLESVYRDCINNPETCGIFITFDSSDGALDKALNMKVDFKKFFTIKDEVQDLCAESDQVKLETLPYCAIVNPKYRNLFGKVINLTGTPVDRVNSKDKNGNQCSINEAVFNDDVEKFGIRAVTIGEIEARKYGFICDTECLIASMPATEEWLKSIKERRPIVMEDFDINNIPIEIQAELIAGLRAVEVALEAGKTHILMLVGLLKCIESPNGTGLIDVMQKLAELNPLYKDVTLIGAKASRLQSDVSKFNKANKSIMVATRCIATGQDTYMCDTLIPCYEPKSGKQRAQSGGRKDRKPYMGKISWFILPVIQGYDKDSLWYPYIEEMSNGQNLKILSTADLIALNNQSPVGGVTKHPAGGISIGANVGLIQTKAPKGPKNHNPIYFDKHKVLFDAIAIKKFTDDDGNSRFSEIIRNFNLKTIESVNSLEELININEPFYNKLYRDYDTFELDNMFQSYSDYTSLPTTLYKLQLFASKQSKKNISPIVVNQRLEFIIKKMKLKGKTDSQIKKEFAKNRKLLLNI
jgi:hypothetical protein